MTNMNVKINLTKNGKDIGYQVDSENDTNDGRLTDNSRVTQIMLITNIETLNVIFFAEFEAIPSREKAP